LIPLPHTAPIAVVVSQLGYGGAERQTVELLKALATSTLRPRLVVSLSAELRPYGAVLQKMGYSVEVVPRHANYDVTRVLRLRRLLLHHEIKLVHAVHLLASGYTWLASRLCSSRWKLLPTFRGATSSDGGLKRAIYSRMLLDSSVVLVNSHCGAEYLSRRFGVGQDKVRVVPNGLDIRSLIAASAGPSLVEELGISGPIVGFIGKSSRVKNLPRFLEVFRRLLQHVPDVHAVLIGHGLGHEAQTTLAPDLPPDRMHFLGARDDVARLLPSFDVLVLTSDSEGCPNVILEACALGTPVVAADVGDVRRILQLSTRAAVVPPADLASYVTEIIRLLREGHQATEEIDAVRSRIEHTYGLDRMVDETTDLWTNLLAHDSHLAATSVYGSRARDAGR
jgi:glycosyltransferase involved in cell wall biosynthesis